MDIPYTTASVPKPTQRNLVVGLGVVQLVASLLSVGLYWVGIYWSTVLETTEGFILKNVFYHIYVGYWCGAVFATSGILAVLSGYHGNRNVTVASLTLAVVSVIFLSAHGTLIFFSLDEILPSYFHAFSSCIRTLQHCQTLEGTSIILTCNSLEMFTSFVMLIVSVWLVVIEAMQTKQNRSVCTSKEQLASFPAPGIHQDRPPTATMFLPPLYESMPGDKSSY